MIVLNTMENMKNICRSCLTGAETFSYYIYENVTPELYWFCTSIEVKLDSLPKALCCYCYELLQKLTEFKKTCMQSEETLLRSVTNLKLEDETNLKKEDSNLEYSKENVTCLVKKEDLNDGFQDDTSDVDILKGIVNYKKRICSKEKQIKSHIFRKTTKTKTKLSKFKFPCELCNKKFALIERFEAHKLTHDGKKESIQCKPCNKTFSSWSGLHRHRAAGHSLITFKDLTCKVCSKVCKTPLTLKTHNKTHEERKVQICDECGKEFISELTLKNHLETHLKNRKQSYVCEHCGKKYLSKKTRAKHIYRRHTDRHFICHYCNFPFGDKTNLIRHIMIHEGKQKLYKCDLCSRALTSHASLVVHKRIHTGERPFSCSYCPKRFSNKGILMDHHRTHTGEKPYKCVVCEQSFAQRGTMRRHMKVHDRPQP